MAAMVWGSQRGIDDLVERLRRNDPALTSLHLLKGRRFNDADAQQLADALHSNTSLLELSAASNAVSPAAAAALARALAVNRTLRSLDLGNRSFGDEGLAALAPGIAASPSLRRLNLEAKGMTAAGCATLGAALAASAGAGGEAGLRELLLGQNDVGGEGLAALLQGLASGGGSLLHLDLPSCGLHGDGAVHPLAAAMREGRLASLQILRLDGNALGDGGAAALAPALVSGGAASLAHLHLQRCSVGQRGVAALAAALPAALQELDLSGNSMGGEGGSALAAALAAGAAPGLQRLQLCDAGLEDGGIAAIAAALMGRWQPPVDGRRGLALDVSGNAAGAAAVAALSVAPLSALCLHDCKLGPGGGAALPAALAPTGGFAELEELDLSGNRLEAAQLLPLLAALAPAPGGSGSGSGACPRLRLLVLAANPGAAEDEVAAAIERLQASRQGLDVVRRAADTGEGGLPR